MIAGVRGRVAAKLADAVLVDVVGVVYRVNTSGASLAEAGEVGEETAFHTHLFVREDQLTLYGFVGTDELRLFETLIAITGVGPKLACTILTKLRPDALAAAIANEDANALATVPGVGRKTAARLILELRGKLVSLGQLAMVGGVEAQPDADVVEALRALGYTLAEANAAVARSGAERHLPVEERVVAALREMGPG